MKKHICESLVCLRRFVFISQTVIHSDTWSQYKNLKTENHEHTALFAPPFSCLFSSFGRSRNPSMICSSMRNRAWKMLCLVMEQYHEPRRRKLHLLAILGLMFVATPIQPFVLQASRTLSNHGRTHSRHHPRKYHLLWQKLLFVFLSLASSTSIILRTTSTHG